MKTKLNPWRVSIPIIMIGALILIGADAPGPSPDLSDADADSIPDALESAYFIDQNVPFHALLDPDNDGLTTFQELTLYGTDPMFQDSDFLGQLDGSGESAPLNSYYIQFGAPWYWTSEGEYVYPRNRGKLVMSAWAENGEFFSTYDASAGRVVRKVGEGSTEAGWRSVAGASNEIQSLNVALNRQNLTTNDIIIYALHLMDSAPVNGIQPTLYVDLLAADGQSVVYEDLYGNILGAVTNNEEALAILEVPTAYFQDAAVIRLRAGSEGGPGAPRTAASPEIVVYEALLYEVPAFDQSEWDTGLFGGGAGGGGDDGSSTNWVRTYETDYRGSNTNSPVDPGGGNPPDDEDHSSPTGVIIVDQAKGSDSFNGRSATVMSGKIGPKKTVGKGMIAVDKDRAHTLVIKSGTYNENLNMIGKNVRVVIDGKVKL